MTEMNDNRLTLAGRAMSGLVLLALLADAGMNLFAHETMRPVMEASQLPLTLGPTLGVILVACAALYAIPRTAMLGAILITGFLGGAILAHLRLGEFASPPQIVSLLLGAMTWGGLYLRDARLRALMPVAA
jgi:hypothetical protein